MSLPGQGMGHRMTWAPERGEDSEGLETIGGQSAGMTGYGGQGWAWGSPGLGAKAGDLGRSRTQ